MRKLFAFLCSLLAILPFIACENLFPNHLSTETKAPERSTNSEQGQLVKPPFDVRGELEGLLIVWIDKDGLHSAGKRSEIPENKRQNVRVDSLQLPPEKRLEEEYVYLADLRKPQRDGSYLVKKVSREWFESLVDSETPEPPRAAKTLPMKSNPGNASSSPSPGNVVIYGASWCGACRAAASYLRARNVAFEEKDIEKDRDAYAEMHRKATAAGVNPGGLPVIDFHGRIISGFSADALGALIQRDGR